MSDEDYWADVAASLGHPQDVEYDPDDDVPDPPRRQRQTDHLRAVALVQYGTRYAGVQRIDRFCVTLGHETVPAAAVGTYDDGNVVFPGTAYCARCAELMTRAGDWTADPSATGTSSTSDLGRE